jgi:hypothetical protein
MVSLSGGSFDGQIEMATPPPGALRLYTHSDEEQWSELYLYAQGQMVEHPEHGTLPVMLFSERKVED